MKPEKRSGFMLTKQRKLLCLALCTIWQLDKRQTNCDGIYLPADAKLAGQAELTEPTALQFVSGTQLVIQANPTGEIEFNLPPAKTLTAAAEGALPLPNLTLASVEATAPNGSNRRLVNIEALWAQDLSNNQESSIQVAFGIIWRMNARTLLGCEAVSL